ncbi:MAG: hypothetical protein ACJ8F1_15095 [Polyangia bacterium]
MGSGASCDSDGDRVPVPSGGGLAIVLRDASAPGGPLDGGSNGGHGGKGGNAGRGGAGGAAGRGAAGAGTAGAGTGGVGTGGSNATGAGGMALGTGGAGGGAPPVDACRACELRRCTNPQNGDGSTIIAYDLCFLDQPVPATPPEFRELCGGDNLWDHVTSGGDHPGTPKTDLCHAVLACIARTKCAGPFGTDDIQSCYCGAGITAAQCSAVTFVPQGPCAAVMAAGYETTSNPAIAMGFNAACLASGAAVFAYSGCYESCCSKECLGIDPPAGVDDETCNAAPAGGNGGANGTGGTTATGGTSGTAGKSGTSATGGTPGGGGSGGVVASGGHGGGTGAAGSGGAGGGAPPPGLAQFNGTTAPWTASYGSVVSYSSTDAGGASTSGSLNLAVMNGAASITSIVAAAECVAAVAGATYDLSAQVFVPQQMSGSLAGLGLWSYASNDCSGAPSGTFASPQVAAVGVWQPVSGSPQLPAGTQSMSVRLTVTKPAGQTGGEARFDNVDVTKR